MTDSSVASSRSGGAKLWRAIGRVKGVISGWPDLDRRKRYLFGGGASILGIWLVCAAYLLFMPKS